MARISEDYQENEYDDDDIGFNCENIAFVPEDYAYLDDSDPQDYEDRNMDEIYDDDVGLLKEYLDPSSKVSKKELWNLKMDIEGLKKKVTDVQNTASDMPREYVKKICDFQSYPFETPISVDQDLNNWCSEVDDFIDDGLNFDDKNKYYIQSLRGGKGREYTGMLAESKLFKKILRAE